MLYLFVFLFMETRVLDFLLNIIEKIPPKTRLNACKIPLKTQIKKRK